MVFGTALALLALAAEHKGPSALHDAVTDGDMKRTRSGPGSPPSSIQAQLLKHIIQLTKARRDLDANANANANANASIL